jgi:hypothetical protein
MSLDNISHLDSQALDELVPSRYAVQVGEIDVLVISDGVLPITAPTLATNADSADLAGWLDDMFLPPDVLDWPLNVVLVHSDAVSRGGRSERPRPSRSWCRCWSRYCRRACVARNRRGRRAVRTGSRPAGGRA